jgi:hypothetical protein
MPRARIHPRTILLFAWMLHALTGALCVATCEATTSALRFAIAVPIAAVAWVVAIARAGAFDRRDVAFHGFLLAAELLLPAFDSHEPVDPCDAQSPQELLWFETLVIVVSALIVASRSRRHPVRVKNPRSPLYSSNRAFSARFFDSSTPTASSPSAFATASTDPCPQNGSITVRDAV